LRDQDIDSLAGVSSPPGQFQLFFTSELVQHGQPLQAHRERAKTEWCGKTIARKEANAKPRSV